MPSPLPPVLRMVRLLIETFSQLVGWMRPHQAVAGGEIFEANVVAADRLDERGMAQRILRHSAGRPSAGLPAILPGPDDADVIGVDGVDQADASRDPLAFPADLGDGIVGEIGGAGDGGVLFETQSGVRAERDGAGEIVAGGHQDFAAAQHRAAIDGLLDRGGVFRGAVALGAEIADIQNDAWCRVRRRLAGFATRGLLCCVQGGERRNCRSRKQKAAPTNCLGVIAFLSSHARHDNSM